MNTTHSSTPEAEVPGYAELQREMHDALRAQHPEWVQPNGDSPICDAYESRFEELLSLSLQFERAHAHYARQAYQTKKNSLSQSLLPHETCRMNRVQHLKTKKRFLVFADSGFVTYQPQT
ncbi:MAG TPA: hypothetical protein VJ420_13290 [Candidatus Udaeobacter sp.]|nr:hypothetical protein [Candidatus Udaeobacter sp.]